MTIIWVKFNESKAINVPELITSHSILHYHVFEYFANHESTITLSDHGTP